MFTTHTITDAYKLETDRFGFYRLTRLCDGAGAFFQGDDADLWSRNMEAIERCFVADEPRLVATFDCLCSGYDDALSVEGVERPAEATLG